jgi:uncharacterized protein YecE (DUF72 family)
MLCMPGTWIGISGWTYAGWRGTFYPKGLSSSKELTYASRKLNSIEVNGSFYRLPRPENYLDWYEQTPQADFMFSVKAGRFITHIRRLKEIEEPVANFFASGILGLKEKLGPILWQFPPNMPFDEGRFENFFAMLPHDFEAAAKVARRRSGWLKGRASWSFDVNRPIRHAVEIRHFSFLNRRYIDLLRAYDIAFVFADSAGKFPYTEDATSDFIYMRLHGAQQIYTSGYTDAELDWWAKRIAAWRSGKEPPDARRIGPKARKIKSRDIYVYFDNDVKVQAPFDAMRLAERVGIAEGKVDERALRRAKDREEELHKLVETHHRRKAPANR